jgi:hypothetical protein
MRRRALIAGLLFDKFAGMKRCISTWRSRLPAARTFLSLLLLPACVAGWGEAPAAAVREFNDYIGKVESRLVQQHRSPKGFVASVGSSVQTDARLRRGEVIVEKLTPAKEAEMSGALLHHWRGTAFVHGAAVADFEQLMKDFSGYPQRFAPQIVRAAILSPHDGRVPDHFAASMRVRHHHVITVVMDTAYEIRYGRLDGQHGYNASWSTRISEIASAGTSKERLLSDGEEHGFLWRMNTYWSYEERDGGLYMQVESVSLTRSIPVGLGWVVRPYVESVPRESLEFTLRAVCNALRK